MNKSTSTRLGQILLDKGLITAAQLDIAIKEQQKRRQLLDPFDENLGVNSSLGEVLIELGFIDRLQLRRGLNWQLMLRKMAIVMSFCAPLMAVSSGAAAASGPSLRPTFTAESSSAPAKANPSFTKTSSSASSVKPVNTVSSISSRSSSSKSSVASLTSSSKSSAPANTSNQDKTAPKMPEISVVTADHNHVQLQWSAPSSESGVAYYKIYRDQVEVDVVDLLDGYRLDFDDYSVSADKAYLYGISAGDSAGNWSPVKSIFVQTGSAPLDNGSGFSSSSMSSGASSEESSSVEPAVVTSSSTSSAKSSSVASSASNSSKAVSSATSSASSASAVSSSKSSAKSSVVASSASSSAKSSVASSSSSSGAPKNSQVAGPVSLNWAAPTLRENGNALDITEIGGYELRYRKTTDVNFTYVTINDAWKNTHNFSWLEGTYLFQVAAFDKHGVYSNFVDLAPH